MEGFLVVEGAPLFHEIKKMEGSNFIIPRSLKEGHFIIGMKYASTDTLASFIYFSSSEGSSASSLKPYVMICYSFTEKAFRGRGLNTFLREKVKEKAIDLKSKRIISVPFDGAGSVSILEKLGYRQEGGIYILEL